MLLYNWNKVFKTCKANPPEIIRVFKMLVDKDLPLNKYDPVYKYSNIDFSGQSFLVHPDVLLYQLYKYSYRDVCIYIAFAALRSYGEYQASGKITLDLLHLQLDPEIFINNNRLLWLEGDDIHFLHEEVPTEKN